MCIRDRCIGNPHEWNRAYAEGNELTLLNIVEIIRNALAIMKLDEDNWDLDHPYELRTSSFIDPETKEIIAPGEYTVYFHQMIGGIPLLNHAGATYNQKTRGNAIIRLRGTVINLSLIHIYLMDFMS